MKELEYPFDAEYILRKKKSIRKKLLSEEREFLEKKIAILCGSTVGDIKQILELFLLNYAIKAEFYESDYNKYYEDAVFCPEKLIQFHPDIIYIHTSNRNIENYPEINDSEKEVENKLNLEYQKFQTVWDSLKNNFNCIIIQNNMELLNYRMLGNKDGSDIHGRTSFINRLNEKFYSYARQNQNFYINDIHYLSSCYGLEKWADPFYWYMYKYALNISAIPELACNIAHIIKAVYGKNKKALVLDLDNTLWGGVIGDDGVEGIEIGQEMAAGQAYAEFQDYLRKMKNMGILLNISSKNEEKNAYEGLRHPDGILKEDDFVVIKANWREKGENIREIAEELHILTESMVFIDDNPAERERVTQLMPEVAVPEITTVEKYICQIDRQGYFEFTGLSQDDLERNQMYQANRKRTQAIKNFCRYEDYLKSLEMKAVFHAFEPLYFSRITQLINKSNQFNLTTKRYSNHEIERISNEENYITIYGKLQDKFGDNGIVTVVIGRQEKTICHIDLWLMSCRVLKRDMEYAVMDYLVYRCREQGIETIRGYYYPSSKNAMVKDFYHVMGFEKESDPGDGSTVWNFCIRDDYKNKNNIIDAKSYMEVKE